MKKELTNKKLIAARAAFVPYVSDNALTIRARVLRNLPVTEGQLAFLKAHEFTAAEIANVQSSVDAAAAHAKLN